MRRIISKEEQAKKRQRNQLIIGAILIGVMIISTAGYSFMDKEMNSKNVKKLKYNGIDFQLDDSGYWNFVVNNNKFMTRYNPNDTAGISFYVRSSVNNFAGKPLYIASDFSEPNYEIYRALSPFVSRINPACMSENCSGDFPRKDCTVDNVIVINEPDSEFTGIIQDNNCIVIVAPMENQTLYADAVLFRVLGI